MGLSEVDVINALRPVKDPELGVSIVDLGMVKEVGIRRGRVSVTVALTVAGCPMKDEITRLVTTAVEQLDSVKTVEVALTVMSQEDLAAVRSKVQSSHSHAQSGPSPLGHESGRMSALARPGSRTRVVGVTSGKGGVGKSSLALNLAVSLAAMGLDVGLLDADVYGFSIPRMLGHDDPPRVDSEKMIPPQAHGVKFMSMGMFVDDDQPVMWRGPMLHKALEQFLVDVDWGEPDFLLIDMPPGTGDVALSMAQYLPASEVYVITTPQPAARRVAQRTAYMAKKINLPLRGVIENMSWFTADDGSRYQLFGEGGGLQLAEELGVPLLGQIPLVQSIREGGDLGLPVSVSAPQSEAALAYASVARELAARGRSRVFHPELNIS